MNKLAAALTLLLIAGASTAQTSNPCELAWGAGFSLDAQGKCQKPGNSFFNVPGEVKADPTPVVLALILQEQRREIEVQQQLTNTLKAAVDALNKASADLKTSNVTWRKDVLDTTVAQINAVPAAMATNPDLLHALIASLAANTEFRKLVQQVPK